MDIKKVTNDWTNADQFLDEKINRNNNSIKHDFGELTNHVNASLESVENEVKMLNGVAEGQYITDSAAKMVKVVPDGVNKGVVSMVGGKTHKCKNILNLDKMDVSLMKTYGITAKNENGYMVLNGTSTKGSGYCYADYDVNVNPGGSPLSIVLGKTYTFSLSKSVANENVKLVVFEDKGSGFQRIHYKVESATVQTVANARYIFRVEVVTQNVVLNNYKIGIQIEEGETATSYEPYHEDLWNAPVKKVVLNSANLFNKDTCIDGGLETDGSVGSNSQTAVSDYIPVIGGETYFLNNVPNQSVARTCAEYDVNKTFIKITSFSNPNISGSITMSANTRYIRITVKRTDKNIATVNRGTTAIAYKPYNKTTLSLERIVDKLPDYGASIGDIFNYIDFENMVYHHVISSTKFKDNEFTKLETSRFFTTINDIKNTIRNTKLLTENYESKDNGEAYDSSWDKVVYSGVNSSKYGVYIIDTKCNTGADVVNNNADNTILYELDKEELIPLTDLLLPFKCEPGGTITFENEHNLDVPNSVIYEKEVLV